MAKWIGRMLCGLTLVALVSAPAAAQVFTLTANLTGGNETPTPVTTGSFGTATITVDIGKGELTYRVDVFNMPSGVTTAHIHAGSPGVTGPTVFTANVPTTASNDFVFSGTWTEANFDARPAQGVRTFLDAIQMILGGASYFNVHSQTNPGGEIRGPLVLKQP